MSGRIEEHVVAADADILVGVPCYKDGPMVERCLRSLQEPKVQLLIVDNGSAPDVKQALAGRGVVIRNEVNRYVNPAWNQMMEWFLRSDRYDLLVLANSDLVMTAGWSSKLRAHRTANRQEQIIFGKVGSGHSSMGAFFAMTRRSVLACCPIPDDILIYGGDDFIFEVNRRVGFSESVAEDVTMFHAVSGTISKSPELWDIGKRDNARWHHHVLPKLVPPRIEEFLRKK
jgi:glycosyltransferase involved in cell wall biosynthesis